MSAINTFSSVVMFNCNFYVQVKTCFFQWIVYVKVIQKE